MVRERLGCCSRSVSSNRIKKIAQPQQCELQSSWHRPNLLAPMKEHLFGDETSRSETKDASYDSSIYMFYPSGQNGRSTDGLVHL